MDDIFDAILNQLDEKGFAVVDEFISQQSVETLLRYGHDAIDNGEFNQAGIGRQQGFHTNDAIRKDHVHWLTQQTIQQECPQLYNHINSLIEQLNRICFSGINQCEFHLANYEPGAYYKRHLDQFKNNGDRRFTIIVYLNNQWQTQDGGQLVVYGDKGSQTILPQAGRLVFFPSDKLEHEVLPANRARWSFTGWLKTVKVPQSCCSTNN